MSQQEWKEQGDGGYPVHVDVFQNTSVWTNLHDILGTQVVEEGDRSKCI